jgi:hypothetical protein
MMWFRPTAVALEHLLTAITMEHATQAISALVQKRDLHAMTMIHAL